MSMKVKARTARAKQESITIKMARKKIIRELNLILRTTEKKRSGSNAKKRSIESSGQQVKKQNRRSSKVADQTPVLRADPYTEDAKYYVSRFDFSSSDLEQNQNHIESVPELESYNTAVWIIPHFLYVYYGGIHTIFRFADFLTRKYRIMNSFVVLGVAEITNQPDMMAEAFPALADSTFYPMLNEANDFSYIPYHDLGICTAWQTAYPLLKMNNMNKKLYFMQDFEPYFYPAGSISGLAEATYRFGFTAICNTISLKKSYEAYGGKAVHFHPSYDRSVFYPPETNLLEKDTYRLMFYGRPFGVRNGFETAVEALKKVKAHFGDRVEIISAGGKWNIEEYGLGGIITNLDRIPYKQTGDLYRSCDAGLVLMMTRHTAYIPIELMASGCLVVTNESVWKHWLLRDGVNCLMAEPTATCIAERIIEGLSNAKLRQRLTDNAAEFIMRTRTWDEEFDQAVQKI